MENIKIGIENKVSLTVTEKHSAVNVASGGVNVFATPMLIALMEKTANDSLCPYLTGEQATVGTKINIAHLSATPMGMEVYAVSKLIEVDGRRLVFEVSAFDECGKIGEGTHERFIIDKKRFMEKVDAKNGNRN